MAFLASTQKFEGPLDLMLHLIRENELDIFDLDMIVLTEQYLAYIQQMEDLKLEVESEYLVELATLVEYKSKKLLPKDDSKLEGEYEEDPKDVLVRRLLEYQKYQGISQVLNESYLERKNQLSKPISNAEEFRGEYDNELLDGNPNDLLKAMNKVLRRIQLSKPIETKYTHRELSVDDRVLQITARLINFNDTFNFEELLDDCHEVHEFIVTFLAILDLAKNRVINFSVDENENIWLRKGSL